jgi:hypothetical protein
MSSQFHFSTTDSQKINNSQKLIFAPNFSANGFEDTDLVSSTKIFQTTNVDLVDHDNQRFVGKQRLDTIEQFDLLLQSVTALFWNVHEVEHSSAQMCQGSDGLHFDCIPFFQRLIQYPGCVNHLGRKKN